MNEYNFMKYIHEAHYRNIEIRYKIDLFYGKPTSFFTTPVPVSTPLSSGVT